MSDLPGSTRLLITRRRVCPLLVLAGLAVGCAGRAGAPRVTARPGQTAGVQLPDWAPKHPSPEFLRAAKLLKPMSNEEALGWGKGTASLTGGSASAFAARLQRTWPAAWEFFGTLSDHQVRRLQVGDRVAVPVRSMTAVQRKALDREFEAYRENMAPSYDAADEQVMLYRFGAATDLSNVKVVVTRMGQGQFVGIDFRIRLRDGSTPAYGWGRVIGRIGWPAPALTWPPDRLNQPPGPGDE